MHVGCGPRCLKKTLKHYGFEVDLEEVAKFAGEEKHETSLAGLMRAAAQCGFEASAEAWTMDEMFEHGKTIAGRAILHFEKGHFVVLEDISESEARIVDPFDLKRIKTRYSREELKEAWSGKLLVIRGKLEEEES